MSAIEVDQTHKYHSHHHQQQQQRQQQHEEYDMEVEVAGGRGNEKEGGEGEGEKGENSHGNEEIAEERRKERVCVEYEARYQRFIHRFQERRFAQQYSHIYLKRLLALRPRVLTRIYKSFSVSQRKDGEQQQGEQKDEEEEEDNNDDDDDDALAQQGVSGRHLNVVDKIIDLKLNEVAVVVGTLYKEQKLKPCILDEFALELSGEKSKESKAKETSSHSQSNKLNFASEEDSLILEDETGRIGLNEVSKELVGSLVTGTVVGIQGKIVPSGDLLVLNYCFPEPAPQLPCPKFNQLKLSSTGKADQGPLYVLLVSGLHIGGSQNPLPTQLLTEYITGYLGNEVEHDTQSKIVRVIIAGELVHSDIGTDKLISSSTSHQPKSLAEDPANTSANATTTFRASETGTGTGTGAGVENYSSSNNAKKSLSVDKPISSSLQERMAEPLRRADVFLTEVASACPVDLLPGETDPCNLTMPQQPLHSCLFPQASRFRESSFNCVTNPYECKLAGGLLTLGHSGQPLQNIEMYTTLCNREGEIALLEQSLHWSHIAPTAPDTLPCYPFYEQDPFIIDETPHLFFAGNQSAFDTKLVQRYTDTSQMTRLVCIPRFAETSQAVLVDISSPTLETSVIEFSV